MISEPGGELYEAAVQKLIARTRDIHAVAGEWSPTPLRKELLEVAERIEALSALLDRSGAAQSELERRHKMRRRPEQIIGVDGYPEPADDAPFASYEGVRYELRELARSAREAAAELPDPREKRALPFAALGVLLLRRDYEFPPAVMSDDGADVVELERVCCAAGLMLSRQRLRGALTEARRRFDLHFTPPEYKLLLRHSEG